MINSIAWIVFVMGIGHLAFGLYKYKVPLTDAARAGLVGQFGGHEVRRTAVWFLLFGPFLMLAGQAALHANAAADLPLLKAVGLYLLVASIAGAVALPRSPFIAGVITSAVLVAGGYGWL